MKLASLPKIWEHFAKKQNIKLKKNVLRENGFFLP